MLEQVMLWCSLIVACASVVVSLTAVHYARRISRAYTMLKRETGR